MPRYVYGCSHPDHPRADVVHGFNEEPELRCATCGAVQHRIPQPFLWAWHPSHALLETMDRRFGEWKAKEKRRRASR
jgi:hypothetical protein